ncbi:MAG TPA: hypothetical protein VME86_00050 [Acidobacteriaceae bacterium]|nr:hypothetical protein [Acidobacteriaceae bacterium]
MRLSLKTILTAGLTAGTLDLALAIIYFGVTLHAPFTAVPQAVASGLLGARAYRLGIPAALLGIFLHYFIALTVADFYYAASLRVPYLNLRPILSGAVYGVAVYLIMQHIVIPLSRHPTPRNFGTSWLIANIASHIFFIGITIALITRHYSTQAARTGQAAS